MEKLSMQILQNDVEHVEKNMKTFSLQLRILQDFIQLEFGSKFQTYFAQQLSLSLPTPAEEGERRSSRVTKKPVVSNYKPEPESSGAESNVGAEDNNEEQETAAQTSDFPIISCSGDEDDGDLNEENENEDSDIEFFAAPDGLDQLETSGGTSQSQKDPDYKPAKRRRKNPKNWSHDKFPEVSKQFKFTSPTKQAECLTCGMYVSNRLYRLRAHLSQKCSSAQQDTGKKKTNNRGYPKSPIRRFFTPCKVDGIVKSKCLRCGKLVSDKALRLKNHHAQCVKETKKKNSNDESDLEELDESFTMELDSGSNSTLDQFQNDLNIVDTSE